MPPPIPWMKLPNSASGYFLALHTGLLFFWLLNRSDSSISYLLPLSISGIVIGWIMYYPVKNHLDLERKYSYKTEFDISNSALWNWFFALIAYVILFYIINWLMQPPAPPLNNGWVQ